MKKELFSLLMLSLPVSLLAEDNDIESISWDRTSRLEISSSMEGGISNNVLTLSSSSFKTIKDATVLMQDTAGSILYQDVLDIPAVNVIQIPIPMGTDGIQVIDWGTLNDTTEKQETDIMLFD